jgi:hypothetical protein
LFARLRDAGLAVFALPADPAAGAVIGIACESVQA